MVWIAEAFRASNHGSQTGPPPKKLGVIGTPHRIRREQRKSRNLRVLVFDSIDHININMVGVAKQLIKYQ
jgi:hypothetical protein